MQGKGRGQANAGERPRPGICKGKAEARQMHGKGKGQANARERQRRVESDAKVIKVARQKKCQNSKTKAMQKCTAKAM